MRIPAAALMAAVFLSASISISAQAVDPGTPGTGGARVYGPGTKACGTWLIDRGDIAAHNVDLGWVLGYLSAWSAFAAGMKGHIRHTNANAVAAWVNQYCRDNPLKNVVDASQSLVAELAKPE